MSRYTRLPIDFTGLKTIGLAERRSTVIVARPPKVFFDSLPAELPSLLS